MSMRLYYFNVRGRGEVVRYLFKLAGKDFVDDRIKEGTWADIKPTMPLAQVPLFQDGDKQMVQSMAIARYVARELGLSGSSSWEQAICDMFCETCQDVRAEVVTYFRHAKTEEEKKTSMEKVEKHLDGLEKLISLHKKGKFILGDQASLADSAISSTMDLIETKMDSELIKKRSNINTIHESFLAIPAIAEWVKTRPVTTI